MKISSSAYFGVESLVRLAAYDATRPCPTELLAQSVGCSVLFTEQLMGELCVAGLVRGTWQGRRGYYLSKPPHRITVAEVFRAFGEPHTLDRCFASGDLDDPEIDDFGGTNLLWKSLNGSILLFLESVSLADIAPPADGATSKYVSPKLHLRGAAGS